MSEKNLKLYDYLNYYVDKYNNMNFIENDPISIPHRFTKKEDIEIIGFLISTIAWGNRKMIINNGAKLAYLMDNSPYEFIQNFKEKDLIRFQKFCHRTFNYYDTCVYMNSLQHIYKVYGGLNNVFFNNIEDNDKFMNNTIEKVRKIFFENEPENTRTKKHFANPNNGSAAKRINMYLRWMVRNDDCGVDFGIWKNISPSILSCPLDVHSGNIARKLGIINSKHNNWKSVLELDNQLRIFDVEDPVKYDFALFGLGVNDDFDNYKI